jgi:hypothetical protein
VWDHRPTADELLDARVAAGWTPRTSSLREGERVLGHACKLSLPSGRDP